MCGNKVERILRFNPEAIVASEEEGWFEAKAFESLQEEISDEKEPTPKRKADNTIIHFLEDQQLHSVSGIASYTNIPAEKVELLLRFLAKYSFITYDEPSGTTVICADFFSLEETKHFFK